MDEQTEGSKGMPKNKECDANAKVVCETGDGNMRTGRDLFY